ncbi:hypothetical protein PHLCEN_2v4070 [Hermanssonia centrifuga]|uniref:Uncharacterized protein n=1 Tax=Hermanssonia centrifuga TaxID=98765 RepID=A0A2R6Q5C8_9APHY|nr:hypothetical protein PHLCEN_2v4070 [Hermanssonia centrifuga]
MAPIRNSRTSKKSPQAPGPTKQRKGAARARPGAATSRTTPNTVITSKAITGTSGNSIQLHQTSNSEPQTSDSGATATTAIAGPSVPPIDFIAPQAGTITDGSGWNPDLAQLQAKLTNLKATGKQTIAAITAVTLDQPITAEDIMLVAAVSHAVSSSVLGSEDESWSSDSEYVPSPTSVPHIPWCACLHTPSGLSNVMPMLIDSGSTTVLICEDVATSLNLRHCPLQNLFHYKGAFGEDIRTSTVCGKLRVSTTNSSWSSITVTAIIVPKLCSPVISGLPFHAVNKLVIYSELQTMIVRSTRRDLLKPAPIQVRNHRTEQQQQKEEHVEQQQRDEMAQEGALLKKMFLDLQGRDMVRELKLRSGKHKPCIVTGLTHDKIVAMIQQQANELAIADLLSHKNTTMRLHFADLSPNNIPHISKLPTNVYHHFHLKDPNLVIARCQYKCPKKYREVWKTLLTQHLEAGCLRPSSSPYASPAFLIAKNDKTALPCWVNDYRKLNANTIPDVHPLLSIAEIFSDCGKGKFFAKINMTNSFFQTCVHPDDIHLMAVTTPFGLYE